MFGSLRDFGKNLYTLFQMRAIDEVKDTSYIDIDYQTIHEQYEWCLENQKERSTFPHLFLHPDCFEFDLTRADAHRRFGDIGFFSSFQG